MCPHAKLGANVNTVTREYRFRYLSFLAPLFLATNTAVRLAPQTGFPDALPFGAGMFAGLPGLSCMVFRCLSAFPACT